jgi:U1 small nuclear ribonucleoprotein
MKTCHLITTHLTTSSPFPPPHYHSQSFLASKIDEKRRLQESVKTGHKTGLPPELLRLFQPREPLKVLPPVGKKKKKAKMIPYSGVGKFLDKFASPGDPDYGPVDKRKKEEEDQQPMQDVEKKEEEEPETEHPASTSKQLPSRVFFNREFEHQARIDQPTKAEKMVEKSYATRQRRREAIQAGIASWDPNKDPNIEGDPYKTLFISNLSKDVTERKLRREFEEFGPIKRLRVVHNKKDDGDDDGNNKPRGYAFIEFEHKSDMKEAYKEADGRKIEGKRVMVDVERGRTVPGWKPSRLGGGKGRSSSSSSRGGGVKLPKNPVRRFKAQLVHKVVDDMERKDRGGGRVEEEKGEGGERERGRGRGSEKEDGQEGEYEEGEVPGGDGGGGYGGGKPSSSKYGGGGGGGGRYEREGYRDRGYKRDRGYDRDERGGGGGGKRQRGGVGYY